MCEAVIAGGLHGAFGGVRGEGLSPYPPLQLLFEVSCMHAQSCLTLGDPMDYNLSGSSVCGIFQARILEWVAISSSRGSSQSRDQTHVSCLLHQEAGSLPVAQPGSPHIRLLYLSKQCPYASQSHLQMQERENSVPKGKQQMSTHPKQGCFERMHKATVLYFSTSNWLLPQNVQELNHRPRFLSNFNVYCRFFFSH